jgi:E3 ubiquitin-protein ligase BRE1
LCNIKSNPGILCTFQEELTRAVAKLEKTNKHKLAALKIQGENKQGTPILVLTLRNKNAAAEKVRDKQK